MMLDPGMLLAYALNVITLTVVAAVAVGVPVLVGRDARRRGLSRARALVWALVTLALLPIGAGLYLLLGRPSSDRPGA